MDFTEPVYLIDFSGTQWTLAKAVLDKRPSISLLHQLPADIGFQQGADGRAEVFFQPDLERLDWRLPEVVRLINLADEWYRITDEVVARHLLEVFIQGLFESIEEPGDLYVVIPYRWPANHRQHLRQLFSGNGRIGEWANQQINPFTFHVGFDTPSAGCRVAEGVSRHTQPKSRFTPHASRKGVAPFRFRGFINEGIAMLSYWKNEMVPSCADRFDLVWLDGRLRDLKVWHYRWSKTSIDIKSVTIFNDYALQDSDAIVGEISSPLKTVPCDLVILGTGDADDTLKALIQRLGERFTVALSNIQSSQESMHSLLRGAAYWAGSLTGSVNCATGYQIHYDWAFGVQLDAKRLLEVIPKGTGPPVKRQGALTVRGELSPYPLNLYCCFAPTVNSGLPLASLWIEPERKFIQRGRFEIHLEVELFDGVLGKFSAIVEGQNTVQTTPFRVPVLIE